jgi:rare lipoprotein A (peptidoglycan hydrolase)
MLQKEHCRISLFGKAGIIICFLCTVCSIILPWQSASGAGVLSVRKSPRLDTVHYSGLPTRIVRQKGAGSWYGHPFHNRKTASGQVYNMYGYTAAHRTLPLGSIAKVTNSKTGKSVLVCINDRGPYLRSKVIDLSYRAADDIGKELDSVSVEYFTPGLLSQPSSVKQSGSRYFAFMADHQPCTVPLYACNNLEVFTDFSQAVRRHQERRESEIQNGNQAVLVIVPSQDQPETAGAMPRYMYLVSGISPELASIHP